MLSIRAIDRHGLLVRPTRQLCRLYVMSSAMYCIASSYL